MKCRTPGTTNIYSKRREEGASTVLALTITINKLPSVLRFAIYSNFSFLAQLPS